jgi:hypothetical protein
MKKDDFITHYKRATITKMKEKNFRVVFEGVNMPLPFESKVAAKRFISNLTQNKNKKKVVL